MSLLDKLLAIGFVSQFHTVGLKVRGFLWGEVLLNANG